MPQPDDGSQAKMRVGYGWDSHEFKRGIPLKIGGVTLPHHKGLGGHSDGDVLLHAITDALLGALAAPDIGTLFPPSDPRWKGSDSTLFLREALQRVKDEGYAIVNLDSTMILSAPRIGPHADAIRSKLAHLLGVPVDRVGIKAKTPEGMGTEDAAIAHVVILLEARKPANRRSQAQAFANRASRPKSTS
jgi:2-C-methyl-D-erythritol 2,4-cyclodiphosphate synthase